MYETENMTREIRVEPTPVSSRLRDAVDRSIARYLEQRRRRVDDFCHRHYRFLPSLRRHRVSLGRDLLIVPLNIVWSVIRIPLVLLSWLAGKLKLSGLAKLLNVPAGMETRFDGEIRWLIFTDLLQLPYQQGERVSHYDALFEEILRDEAVSAELIPLLEQLGKTHHDASVTASIEQALKEYGSTRTAVSELSSNLMIIAGSYAGTGSAVYGSLGASSMISSALATHVAVANFWLGPGLGALYYSVFPASVSLALLASVTAIVAIVLAIVSTFAGVITDPVQHALGLHQKRLHRVVDAVQKSLNNTADQEFVLREKYLARIFDVLDVLSLAVKKLP